MSFADALSYLLSLGHETLTIKLGLANTETLLNALGNPHKSFPSVQIAGTNGKGSTAVMLESICRAAGIRVGLFTSPHLISITERIRIDGVEISETEFARLTENIKQTAEELVEDGHLQTLPTFFEHVTAIALLAFDQANVELAILETGLGGRLDSTTAAGARVVAITPVSMDHEEYLGNTLREIAAEKAAIIRPGVTAIVAPQQQEAMAVIQRRCDEVGVRPILSEIATLNPPYQNVRLGLRGQHQITNAATAIALAEALRDHGFNISSPAIVKGLESAQHAGRLELWEGEPPILFDGAHNPAAARALRAYLDEFVDQPITMIFGAMRDKALDEIAAILFPAADRIVLTPLDNPRAATIDQLKAAAPPEFDRSKLYHAESVEQAISTALELAGHSSMILVTGSLYLIGAVQKSHVAVR
jgi:dihydrofolate synthase/folylpolyglutamate synthase